MSAIRTGIIEECYAKSVELLKKNSTKYGVLASSIQKKAVQRNYLSVFSRDASICSLGMSVSGDQELIKIARNSLQTLAKNQAENGEIPNYVKPEEKYRDFWVTGCIDATLWWLVALQFYNRYSGDKKLFKSLKTNIEKALLWASCQVHNTDGLIVQNEASDWADIMPRSGKVLYTNALWYQVAKTYHLKNVLKIKNNFNKIFCPHKTDCNSSCAGIQQTCEAIRKAKKKEHYLSFVNYLFWGEDLDIYGNSLAIIFDLPDKNFKNIIFKKLNKEHKQIKFPIPVLLEPIKKHSPHWRKYMESHNQNLPYQYHNGGIWPFASCFYAIALFKNGKERKAKEELKKIAHVNSLNNWNFNEWFHAKNKKPMGMSGQSWNAGAYILAYHYLKEDFNF